MKKLKFQFIALALAFALLGSPSAALPSCRIPFPHEAAMANCSAEMAASLARVSVQAGAPSALCCVVSKRGPAAVVTWVPERSARSTTGTISMTIASVPPRVARMESLGKPPGWPGGSLQAALCVFRV